MSPVYAHQETVYSGPCDGQSNHMADGTQIEANGELRRRGRPVNIHALASSFLPIGTHVRFTRRVFGVKDWWVHDTGAEFDLYRPNCNYSGWPGLDNVVLKYRIVK
jgi:hypothetical protein